MIDDLLKGIEEKMGEGGWAELLASSEEPVEDPLNRDFLHDCRFFSCDKSCQYGETGTEGGTHDLAGSRPSLCV